MTSLLIRLFVRNHKDVQNPATRAVYGKMCSIVCLLCNILMVLAKLAVGALSGSIAIMADAVNNISDSASSIITLVGFKLAEKPPDEEHPFGHARFEYISALFVAVLILGIGFGVLQASVQKIVQPTPVSFDVVTVLVLLGSILLKMWMAVFSRSIGRKIDSGTLQAVYADSRNDVLSTAAVLLSVVIAFFTGWNLDGWMGLAVAAFILVSGVVLVKDTLNPLLGAAQSKEFIQRVQKTIENTPGVLGTHDLLVHDYGPGRRFASAHVELPADMDVMQSHDILDNLERSFLRSDGLRLTLHYDPIETREERLDPARMRAVEALRTIDERLRLHDFRFVAGKAHDNYIFDVFVPEGVSLSTEELIMATEAALQTESRPVHCHITADFSYSPVQL